MVEASQIQSSIPKNSGSQSSSQTVHQARSYDKHDKERHFHLNSSAAHTKPAKDKEHVKAAADKEEGDVTKTAQSSTDGTMQPLSNQEAALLAIQNAAPQEKPSGTAHEPKTNNGSAAALTQLLGEKGAPRRIGDKSLLQLGQNPVKASQQVLTNSADARAQLTATTDTTQSQSQSVSNTGKAGLQEMLSQLVAAQTSAGKHTQPLSEQNLHSVLNSHLLNQGLSAASGNATTTAPITSHAPAAANAPVTSGPEWASVHIDTSDSKWGQQMLQVLSDKVTLQSQQHLHEAKIRLDPPELGKLDLFVRVDGDKLHVNIHSNSAATREALVNISDRLRAELQDQNFVQVHVNIGSDPGSQSNQSQQEREQDDMRIFAANDSAPAPLTDTPLSNSEHWLSTQA